MKQLLGTGMLSWPRGERVSDRYGLVALFRAGNPDKGETGVQDVPWNIDVESLAGTRGSLLAVLDGQDYDLGTGTCFTERENGMTYIGLQPDEPRDSNWLNVDNLYKVDWILCGYRDVDLYFVQ